MDAQRRKELMLEWKNRRPEMGVISIVCKATGDMFLGTSKDTVSNDLTQYLHAADRMNPRITEYYQSFSPAMFRVLAKIFRAFGQAQKPVSVCGELGGNPLAVIPMVGLGLRKTSMSGSAAAPVKRALSRFSLGQARELGEKVCALPTQEDVLSLLKRSFAEKGLI